MSRLHNRTALLLLKIYIIVALIVAAVMAPLAFSFVPLLISAWYLYSWRWHGNDRVALLTHLFMFFALSLFFTERLPSFLSVVPALPVLLLVDKSLLESAENLEFRDVDKQRWPTDTGLTISIIIVLVLVLSLLLSSLPLFIASIVLMGYFACITVIIFRKMPGKPVSGSQVRQRMIAGSHADVGIKLNSQTGIGGLLFLKSPYEWLKLNTEKFPLTKKEVEVGFFVTPELSGPSLLKLNAQATDRWGLFRTSFELEPVRLYVIPRAKYAVWLARKYLTSSGVGALPLVSNVAAVRSLYGLRRGIEYYGSQLYQPGDSLKNIDWKHSLKSNELISKEFAEFQGRPAIILINLAAGGSEEADKLGSSIIMTALSLARENIPAALASYDDSDVRLTTSLLQPQELLTQSTRTVEQMITVINPVRYLNPPDVSRLRANISRLQSVQSQSAGIMTELLRMEFKSLTQNALSNPATRALSMTLAKAERLSNIILISQRNHDAEALAFLAYDLAQKGNRVITV
jgi:hypothetical protein